MKGRTRWRKLLPSQEWEGEAPPVELSQKSQQCFVVPFPHPQIPMRASTQLSPCACSFFSTLQECSQLGAQALLMQETKTKSL